MVKFTFLYLHYLILFLCFCQPTKARHDPFKVHSFKSYCHFQKYNSYVQWGYPEHLKIIRTNHEQHVLWGENRNELWQVLVKLVHTKNRWEVKTDLLLSLKFLFFILPQNVSDLDVLQRHMLRQVIFPLWKLFRNMQWQVHTAWNCCFIITKK